MASSNLAPDNRIRNWRIQLDLFGYLAVTALIASTLSRLDHIVTFRDLIVDILIHLGGFAGLYYFWRWAAFEIGRRGIKFLNIWQIMSIGFAGGFSFTILLFVAAWVFQVQLSPSFPLQLVGFAIPAAFWLPAGSVISSNYRKYLQIKKRVQDEILQQESVKLARTRALDEYRKNIEGQIQEVLKVTTQEAAGLFASLKEREVENLPQYLRVISGEYFRLISHKLISKPEPKASLFKRFVRSLRRIFETVQESVEARPLNPLWYAIMVPITALPALVQKRELALVGEIVLIIFIGSYLVQTTHLQIAKRFRVNLIKLSLFILVLSIVFPLAFVRLIPTNSVERFYPGAFVILVLAVNFLGHLAQAGLLKEEDFRTRSLLTVELLKHDEKEASFIFAGITRNWARHIHGTFTSKLESSALALETALRENDFAEVEKAITEVGSFLKSEHIGLPASQEVILDEINERCSNWNGLIEFDIKSNIDRDSDVGVSTRKVGLCIEEAILNASRHGDCSWIGIELLNTETLFTIIFKDNGSGFKTHIQGFGSEIFTEATDGQWDIWRDERRNFTVLQLNFRKIA